MVRYGESKTSSESSAKVLLNVLEVVARSSCNDS